MHKAVRGTCRCSRNGGPQTCLPAACGVAQRGPSMAHLHQHKPKTLARGQASRGGRREASSDTASSGWLTRGRRDQGGGTSRGARDASHDDQGCQSGASPRNVLLSSLVQREQAQARASSKGVHFGATRLRPAQRPEGSHCGARAGVTTKAFRRRGPTLVRISVPAVPLQNGQLLAPFPLNIWEEAQGLCL